MTAGSVKPFSADVIENLVRENPGLWRGRSRTAAAGNSLDSGIERLNALLPAGGWPLQSVVELVVDDWGSGELQLLLPLMRDLSGQGSRLAMIGPPYLPYARALEDAGIDLDCLVVVDNQVSNDNRWWCAEKLLHHDQCRLVLVWPQYSRADQVRRLLLAAAAGNSLGVIFSRDNPVDTPVSLRLKAEYCEQGIFVEVLKSRFSWLRGSAVIPAHDFPGMISWP